jgi:DNA repair protein RadA/Sms
MSRSPRAAFLCGSCSSRFPKWVGRCPVCHSWNSLLEVVLSSAEVDKSRGDGLPRRIHEVETGGATPLPTGLSEVDRVLSGGLVAGSVTLLGGEPGIGKSTLLLQAAAAFCGGGRSALYVAAEEAAPQVRARAERLGPLPESLWVVAEGAVERLPGHLDDIAPDLVVVDSIQAVHAGQAGGPPGTVAQVRECAHRLVDEAKTRGTAVVLVGHVTKDGSLAGPRQLEHLVDTVLTFEGDRHHALRALRAVKHRNGAAHELGLFEMTERGLIGVPDPSGLLLGDRLEGVAGSIVYPMMEGRRPLLVELQALVAATPSSVPRRSVEGVDAGRMALLLAVLDKRVDVALQGCDVYALAVGGVQAVEPAADLAIALALISSAVGQPVDARLVACGEVGLAGELRNVPDLPRRLAEAERLGFRRAVVPASAPESVAGLDVVRVRSVSEAAVAAGLLQTGVARPHGASGRARAA